MPTSNMKMNETIIQLTETERRGMEQLIDQLPPIDVHRIPADHLRHVIKVANDQFPASIRERIQQFQRNPNRKGFIKLTNVPVDSSLPPTPKDAKPATDKHTYRSEYTLLMTLMLLGDPIIYTEEKDGILINNICPIETDGDTTEHTGSKKFFDFHTENAYHPFRPDYLGLVGLRSDHDGLAETPVASIIEAIQHVPETAIAILEAPLFRIQPTKMFEQQHIKARTLPVLRGSREEPAMTIHFSLMKGVSEDAEWALECLKNALKKVVVSQVIQPGELVIMDNRVTFMDGPHFIRGLMGKTVGYNGCLLLRTSNRFNIYSSILHIRARH
ncbi:putative inner membrane protein YjeT [Geomicrobium sp. JCM 19037]|uniref:TauD/TfdA family dioxygenase n=1 Tax=Geomicrobium sp. JCM 19037 TaxID=1460634 RepID=UPI00045F30B5|nr:TauD/TfdA family dioxygenase [Geomicrobium sp. JCM 19037]GAK02207.1 putative inner membrane protein YjeT [Geomicrobium sp. JCM 19037]